MTPVDNVQTTGEVRSVSSTGGEKGTKPERFDLLPPEALAIVARHYGIGALKYEDHNWRKGYEWSKAYASLQRHANDFWNGQDIDPETGSPNMAAVVFHALTLLQYAIDQPEFDDRYKAPEPEPIRHFAPYCTDASICGVIVPNPVEWDARVGEYGEDSGFTVRRARTTCALCVSMFTGEATEE